MNKKIVILFVVVMLTAGVAWALQTYLQNFVDEMVPTPPAPVAPSQTAQADPFRSGEGNEQTAQNLPPIDTQALYAFLGEKAKAYRGQKLKVFLTASLPPNDILVQLAPEFTKHTGIDVDFVLQPYPSSFSSFTDALRTGEADVLDQEGMWRAAYEPLLEDLRGFEELLYPGYNLADYFGRGGITHFTTPEGKVFGFPKFATIPLFYYIPQYFIDAGLVDGEGNPRIPKTLDEVYEFAKILTKDTDGDGAIDVWGTILSGARTGIHDEINTYYWASSPDAETFDERLQPIFDNPAYHRVLTVYQKLWKEGYAHPDSPITEVGPVIEALKQREIAFAWNWSVFIGFTMDPLVIKSDPQDPWTVRAIPYPALNPEAQYYLRQTVFSLGVSKNSMRKEAAFLFAQWATSPEIQHILARDYYQPDPPRKSVLNDPLVMRLYPHYPYLEQALNNNIKASPALAQWYNLDDVTAVYEQQAMRGELTPEEAAARGVAAMRAELEKQGYYKMNTVYSNRVTGRGAGM